jgi:hypothetical protein
MVEYVARQHSKNPLVKGAEMKFHAATDDEAVKEAIKWGRGTKSNPVSVYAPGNRFIARIEDGKKVSTP